MAKSSTNLHDVLQSIIAQAVEQAESAVRQDVARQIAAVIRDAAPLAAADGPAATGRKTTKPKRAKVFCPVPGCGKVTGGPKWGWFCVEHKDLPKAKKEEYRALRKKAKAKKAGPRKAIKRPCPHPGCKRPSTGPRFSWFCAVHRKPLRGKKRKGAKPAARNTMKPAKKASSASRKPAQLTTKAKAINEAKRIAGTKPVACPVVDCRNQGVRRFSNFCIDHHASLTVEEKKKLREAQKKITVAKEAEVVQGG